MCVGIVNIMFKNNGTFSFRGSLYRVMNAQYYGHLLSLADAAGAVLIFAVVGMAAVGNLPVVAPTPPPRSSA